MRVYCAYKLCTVRVCPCARIYSAQIFVLFDWLHDTLAPPAHRRAQWGWDTPTGRSYGVDYAALGSKGTGKKTPAGAAGAAGKSKHA